MRKTLAGACAAAIALSGCAVVRHASAVPPPHSAHAHAARSAAASARTASATRTGKTKIRVGVRELSFPPSWSGVSRFQAAIGRRPQLALIYVGWNELFPEQPTTLAAKHGVEPLLQIQPGSTTRLSGIAAGRDDAYLRAFAARVRAFRHQVVIGFGHEMNGTWYPWGFHHQSPKSFVAAWRHIVTLFRRAGAKNVTWIWTVSHNLRHTGPLRSYWPGAKYVNWVGIDGYYSKPSDTFRTIFSPAISRIRRFTKAPILLSETAAGRRTGHQARDISDEFAGIHRDHLLGLVWFDVHQHGGQLQQDWRLEDSKSAVTAYRRALRRYAR